MINPVILSKLNARQQVELIALSEQKTGLDANLLGAMMADGIFAGGLIASNLLEAIEMLGPFAVDRSKRIWHYSKGVWRPDGLDELSRRVIFCTGDKYRADHVRQVVSIVSSRSPEIEGLGPRNFLNLENGMLDWEKLELSDHDPKYFSTYQIKAAWNPDSTCPTIDAWMDSSFESDIKQLLWQILGVVINPSMGFQKAIALIGDGFNGKGTFLRLCQSFLPESAICAIDPKFLATNRFSSAELFGKTANICGDIERFTFNSTAEFKKITGEDTINAERKNGHPFTFRSEATMLFSGNKMPPSRDTSDGWFRRWLIVPMTKKIVGTPDRSLNDRMATELDGALVQAVNGLRSAMSKGEFDEPKVCKDALLEYEYSCNSSILFINERLEFSEAFSTAIPRSTLLDAYTLFCRERRLEPDTRIKFYETFIEIGGEEMSKRWTTKPSGKDDRGFVGVRFKPIFGGGF
jgi:P4 family phage/plasmid primase-like protien